MLYQALNSKLRDYDQKYRFFYLIIFIFLFIGFGCTNSTKDKGVKFRNSGLDSEVPESKDIIVYGSTTCPHCVAFMKKLDSDDMAYTFKEVDHNDKNFQEMYDKIKRINYQGYVQYPVLDVRGEIFVAPDYNDFKEKIY